MFFFLVKNKFSVNILDIAYQMATAGAHKPTFARRGYSGSPTPASAECTSWQDRRVSGWVEIKKGPLIFFFFKSGNNQNVLIPKLESQLVHGFCKTRYGHFKYQNFTSEYKIIRIL